MQDARLRRHLLGLLALVLMAGSLTFLVYAEKGSGPYNIASVSFRIGLTLGALWLALPQVLTVTANVPPRIAVTLVVGALIIAARPRAFPIVVLGVLAICVVEGVAWLFRPRPKRRSKR